MHMLFLLSVIMSRMKEKTRSHETSATGHEK
jgi:hypothetical protein